MSAGIVEAGRQFQHDDTSPYRFETLRWEQILAMRGLGFDNLAPDELVELRNHGVNAAFVQEMRSV